MTEETRTIESHYRDPIEVIWVETARRLGFVVVRSDEAYASFDGKKTLSIGKSESLDPDDSMAQLVLHEICHALVQGKEQWRTRDWGLDNTSHADLVQEQAAERVQAALADRYGLRDFFAVTTEWRPYWDALPEDPLADGPDPAIPLAAAAYARALSSPWREPLSGALEATRTLVLAVREFAGRGSLWSRNRSLHPVGFPWGPEGETCGSCGWRYRGGPGEPVDRCRQTRSAQEPVGDPVDRSWRACDRWERPLRMADCGPCGACCREGFHLVPVEADEPLVRLRPDLLVRDQEGFHVPRPGGRCRALIGDGKTEATPHRCSVYTDRPQACRDFPVGGDHCLAARRRVGLSRWGRPR
jgi:hypothetical protein